MTVLRHPHTGHQLRTNDESVEFWVGAGYEAVEDKAPAKKATAKRSSSKTSK